MKLMFSYWDNNNIYVWRSSLLLFVSLLEWIFFTRFTLYHANDRWRSIAVLYIHARQMLIRIWTDKMVFAANVRVDPTTTLHVANSTWKKKKQFRRTHLFDPQLKCKTIAVFCVHSAFTSLLSATFISVSFSHCRGSKNATCHVRRASTLCARAHVISFRVWWQFFFTSPFQQFYTLLRFARHFLFWLLLCTYGTTARVKCLPFVGSATAWQRASLHHRHLLM